MTPKPGFTVKTSAVKSLPAGDKGSAFAIPSGQKVFINMTQAEEVAPMSKRVTLDDAGNEVEGLNIPLSMGPIRQDSDRSGAPCAVLDVIVNPGVVSDCLSDTSGRFRHFAVELALQYAERKHGLLLSAQYKLPKLAYKGRVGGELVPQWVRSAAPKPGITAVSSAAESKEGEVTNAAALGAIESQGGAVVPAPSQPARAPAAPPAHGTFQRGRALDLRTKDDEKGVLESLTGAAEAGVGDDSGGSASAEAVAAAVRRGTAESGGAPKAPLISELQPGGASAAPAPGATPGLVARKSRKLTTGPVAVEAPKVFAKASVRLHRAGQAQAQAWSFADWDMVPMNYGPPAAGTVVTAVTVRFDLVPSQPQVMQWATDLRRHGKVGPALPLAALPGLSVALGEESVAMTAPGHRETSTAVPVLLDVQALSQPESGLTLHVDLDAAAVTLHLPLKQFNAGDVAGPDPGSKPWLLARALDGGGSAPHDVSARRRDAAAEAAAEAAAAASAAAAAAQAAAAAAAAEAPFREGEELPEDKYHAGDALSQHYLEQRKQAAAEAEAKRAANKQPSPYEGLDFKARVVAAASKLASLGPPSGEDALRCSGRLLQVL